MTVGSFSDVMRDVTRDVAVDTVSTRFVDLSILCSYYMYLGLQPTEHLLTYLYTKTIVYRVQTKIPQPLSLLHNS